MKIIFFGTDENASLVLKDLHISSHNILMAVTAPDKVRSRGTKKSPTPVKALCVDNKINYSEQIPEVSYLKNLNPDVIVVASYGRIIPKEIISLPKHGSLNLHPSLLPKYRGPSPVHTAIKNGDLITGVSIITLSEKLDAGPIIEQERHAIEKEDNLKTLTRNLFVKGSNIILNILDSPTKIYEAREQDQAKATMTKKILKKDLHIDWSQPGEKIINHIRALDENNAAYSFLDEKRVKIYKARFLHKESSSAYIFEGNQRFHILRGSLSVNLKEGLAVTVDNGIIIVQELQLEGRGRVKSSEFIRGYFSQKIKKTTDNYWRILEKKLC